MPQELLDYLKTQRVCVVAVEMPDGSPHAATVHFAHREDPLTFVIQTSPTYRKAQPLQSKDVVRASLVVGLEEMPEGKDVTFQCDGEARLLKPKDELIKVYFEKFPGKGEKWTDDIFFAVTPTWWRFTRWNTLQGKIKPSSEDR